MSRPRECGTADQGAVGVAGGGVDVAGAVVSGDVGRGLVPRVVEVVAAVVLVVVGSIVSAGSREFELTGSGKRAERTDAWSRLSPPRTPTNTAAKAVTRSKP